MYEKILATICTGVLTIGVIWFVCRSNSDRCRSKGTGGDTGRVGDELDRAAANNQRLKDAERRTRESLDRARETSRRTSELIGRAGDNNKDGKELVDKAKSILAGARHTD